ncbi:MAG: glycosyltransferase, partial [Actinomyces sp.]|nr:glycosyltransferase [Actinomyces sp.]
MSAGSASGPDVGEKEFKVRIAAIVPCYKEEAAVGTVITDLKNAVPGIEVYVYDNNSSDRTAEVAAAAGAIV